LNLKFNLSQKGIFLVSIPLIFELILVATLAILETQTEQEVTRAFHSARVSDGTNRIVRDLFEIGAVTKGELFSTLSTTSYLNAVQHIREDLEDLRDAVKDDPGEREIVQRTKDAAEEAHDEIEKLRTIYESGDTFKAMDELQSARLKLRSCLKRCVSPELINMGQNEKERLKKSLEIQDGFRKRIKTALIVGVIFNVALTLIVALVFSRQIVRRIQLLVDNSFRLASGVPLSAPVGGSDEIGALDLSFHAMAQALVEAQRKERALIDNAVDVICSIDTNGRFSAISPACEKVFGFSEQELVGANIAKIVLADDLAHVQQALDRIKSGGAEPPFESRLVRKDGRAIDASWAAYWNAREQTVFCVAHDITERKDAERMRQEVIQMVTHDLRTPLATIQTFHEMMSTGMFGELSERGQQLLKKAELNGGRMISLINDLLDIEKIKAGGLEIRQEIVAVHDLLDTAGRSISDWALDRGVLVSIVPTNLTAYADDKRIVQVLVNLLSNAVKFSPRGGTVTLAAEESGDNVVIKVIDEGCGVPIEMRTKIFERFQQVRLSDATEKGGSGLGLAICKAIVELHGGHIKVEANDSQGSVFSFTIPVRAKAASPDQDAIPAPASNDAGS
jgi:PAS domain S-box-containing protein